MLLFLLQPMPMLFLPFVVADVVVAAAAAADVALAAADAVAVSASLGPLWRPQYADPENRSLLSPMVP